ncbi:MAG: hypothetical protein EOP53_01845 [Sphingobacteriales bacterium]|nr:MAG: hypothetical protein EOP53_01845 [Sphingobacteriales bacterium]
MKSNIKKIAFFGFFAASLAFTSCDNAANNNDTADTNRTNYTEFVTRIEGERDRWDTDTAYWETVDRDYEPMRTQMDAEYATADENRKKEIDDVRSRYDKVKGDYMAAREQRMAAANNEKRSAELRTKVFGAEATADLSNVNGKNIRSYYEKLVDNVKQNKESYTPDDWDAVKAWYEKLDAMKNNFEGKDLSAKDNLAIARLKVEYDLVAKTRRIDAKTEQKVDEQTNKMDPAK